MPRQSSRSFGCAVAARRLLPLPCKHVSRSRRPFRFAPGRARPRGCGGAGPAWSAASPRLRVPHPRLALRAVGGWLQGGSTFCVIATRHEQPCPCTVAVRPRRKLLRAIRHRAASPQYVPHREPPAFVASGRSSLPRRCRRLTVRV
jgi:hypothetical protein